MASITANMARPDERSDAREPALYLLYEAHSKGIEPSATPAKPWLMKRARWGMLPSARNCCS